MIGIGRVLIIRSMAPVTVAGQIVALVVTTGTTQSGVRSLQRPIGTVVERNGLPADIAGPMTGLTGRRKTQRLVIGIRGAVVVVQVAGHAVRRCPGIIAVRMTVGTLGCKVLAPKRKIRVGIAGPFPGRGARSVAGLTSRGKAQCLVVRIRGAVVVVPMTRHTGRRRPGIIAVRVTLRAGGRLMLAQ